MRHFEARPVSRRHLRPSGAAALFIGAALAGAACIATPGDVGEPEEVDGVGAAEQALSTCLTIKNALATSTLVEEAQIAHDPADPALADTNFGQGPLVTAGFVGTEYRRIVLKFDLLGGGVPAGSAVSSATLSLRMMNSILKQSVSVHAGTALWDEPTVTWNSLAAAPGGGLGALLATLTTVGVPNGSTLQAALSPIVVGTWLSPGANHGVVLDHGQPGRTSFGSGEAALPSRPELTVCFEPPSCGDGVQNQGEGGVDCGGPCPTACPSCSDGAQNQGEAGVDCGGPCPAICASCADGIQNQDETGVDCGGSVCGPCGGGGLLWSQDVGGTGTRIASGIATMSNGHIVTTGKFNATVQMGLLSPVLTCQGSFDGYIVALDPAGAHLWSRQLGGPGDVNVTSVTVDASDDVIVAGNFNATMSTEAGSFTSGGDYDIFLVKYDAAGNHLWTRTFSAPLGQRVGTRIATDASANIFVGGVLAGTVDFGAGAITSAGGDDAFLAKFDAAGGCLFSKRFGDAQSQGESEVATDAAGNVYMTGQFFSSIDFGLGTVVAPGTLSGYLAKFDPNGQAQWNRAYGSSFLYSLSLAVDAAGNAAVAGYFSGSVTFGGVTFTAAPVINNVDLFIARYDTFGTHLWSHAYGDSSSQVPRGMTTDAWGNLVVIGRLAGTVDFGGGPLTAVSGDDTFVAKLGPSGQHVWSTTYDAFDHTAYAIAADPLGQVVLTFGASTPHIKKLAP